MLNSVHDAFQFIETKNIHVTDCDDVCTDSSYEILFRCGSISIFRSESQSQIKWSMLNFTLLQCYNVTMAFCSFRVESQSLSKHKSYEISKISLKTSGYDGHSLAS